MGHTVGRVSPTPPARLDYCSAKNRIIHLLPSAVIARGCARGDLLVLLPYRLMVPGDCRGLRPRKDHGQAHHDERKMVALVREHPKPSPLRKMPQRAQPGWGGCGCRSTDSPGCRNRSSGVPHPSRPLRGCPPQRGGQKYAFFMTMTAFCSVSGTTQHGGETNVAGVGSATRPTIAFRKFQYDLLHFLLDNFPFICYPVFNR